MSSLSIKLEDGFSPKVKAGEKIVKGQVIASRITSADHEINISNILGIAPSQVGKILVKKPGDRVEESSVVAIKKGALGMGGKKAVSPVAGTVFKFDEMSGTLFIRTSGESQSEDLFSPVDGEVVVCDNEKITLSVSKGVIVAKDAVGEGESDGQIYAFKNKTIEPEDVKLDVKGKIATGFIFQREIIAKSLGLGAIAIIGSNIKDEDLKDLKSRMIKTPVFLVTDEDIEKIIKHDDKRVHVDAGEKTIIFYDK